MLPSGKLNSVDAGTFLLSDFPTFFYFSAFTVLIFVWFGFLFFSNSAVSRALVVHSSNPKKLVVAPGGHAIQRGMVNRLKFGTIILNICLYSFLILLVLLYEYLPGFYPFLFSISLFR